MTERRSRNRIVLVVVLVIVIEPRHPIEDEDEDEEEKFARRAKILRDSSTVDLAFTDLPRDLRARHLTLNAESASNDENIRLRPGPPQQVGKGEHRLKAEFEPYGVQFWMLE